MAKRKTQKANAPPPPDYGYRSAPVRRVWWCATCGTVADVGAGKVDWRAPKCICGILLERRTIDGEPVA